MMIGHYAVALGAKKAAPAVSLGTLFLASQFLDFLWPVMILLGFEHVRVSPGITAMTPLDFYDYPITHSLFMAAVWSIAFGGVFYVIRKSWRGSFVLGIAVLSHWILDFISHRPDLPLAPGSSVRVGLGLWYSVPATVIVEGGFFLAGIVIYLRSTTARDRTGTFAFWGLIAVALLIYIGGMVSPPPPDPTTIGIGGMAQVLIVPWGYWIDRHRTAKALFPPEHGA